MSTGIPNMPAMPAVGYQVTQQPLTPPTPTQVPCNVEDTTLSARILQEIHHSTRSWDILHHTAVYKEKENATLRRQLGDKAAEADYLNEWHRINGPAINQCFQECSTLKEQNATLQGQVDPTEARVAELLEQKKQEIAGLRSQHEAELARVHHQHGKHFEDAEAINGDLSTDGSKLRDGFAELSAMIEPLRNSKGGAEKKEREAIRERNKVVEAELQVRGKLTQERGDHNSQLRTKQETIDELIKSRETREAEMQGKIERLEQLVRDGEMALDKSEAQGFESAAARLVTQHKLDSTTKQLEREAAAREQAESSATAKDEKLNNAMDEILKLQRLLDASEARSVEQMGKGQRAEATLAELEDVFVTHHKRSHPPSVQPEEEPLLKKQRLED